MIAVNKMHFGTWVRYVAAAAFILGTAAGCTTTAKVVPGADVLWKKSADGSGKQPFPSLNSVPQKPDLTSVEATQEEKTQQLEQDLKKAAEERKRQ